MPFAVVKSAVRVLGILEFLSITRRPVSVSEVENALDLPQSSTSVLLRSLVQVGYLEYLPAERKFRPTLRVAVLGDWLKHGLSTGPFTERLEALRARTQETVIVGRRNGADVQYIYVVLSDRDVQFYIREGAKRPMTTSASGRALLSLLPQAMARKIIRRNNADAASPENHVSEQALMASLQEIQASQLSETNFAFGGPRDYHAIATIVPAEAGVEQITLGISGPRSRVLRHRDDIILALREWVTH